MIGNLIYERSYIFQNPYNIMELPAILLYLTSFALRYADIIWVLIYICQITSFQRLEIIFRQVLSNYSKSYACGTPGGISVPSDRIV
jgi:hypothetical protein